MCFPAIVFFFLKHVVFSVAKLCEINWICTQLILCSSGCSLSRTMFQISQKFSFDELQWYRDELYVYVQIQDQHTRDLRFVHLLIKTVYIKSQNSVYSVVNLMIGTSFYFTCIHRMVTFKKTKWRCLIVSLCCRGVKCQLIQVHWRDLFCLLVLLAFSFWNLSCLLKPGHTCHTGISII